ncbi:CsbD family protein [Lichenihabitans sp. Uapishka_5]|uniref:CsbD family protein n=1 Tax=Lichenihabitans sp. Uapishka_5 TaxID=3037302 RepID=UPI0029E813B3|nr:CsbD family protein [Lichenihabitans sp. Uapishka_5]MDX7951355.1 CsbD family protein [Lichenihabitans sp. Uapishka_5]
MVDSDRVVGKVKELGGAAQGGLGDAVGSPGNSVEGRFREAEGQVEQLYGQAKDAVRQGVGQVADAARDLYGDPASYARQRSDVARRQVEANPLVAVLIAGAVGYVLSYLIHGQR